MIKKMHRQIEKIIVDRIVKRNPRMKNLVKAQVWGITEGFSLEDAYNNIALIDYSIYIREKRNQAFCSSNLEEWKRDYVTALMYSSFGTPTLAIQIKDKKISVG